MADLAADNERSVIKEYPLLELLSVSKQFDVSHNGKKAKLSAVNNVSFTVKRGSTLGIVGESGCGKSTLARVITGLHPPTDGEMVFANRQIKSRRGKEMAKAMQMVFQDPHSALNPRSTIGESIGFPLSVQGMSRGEIAQRVAQVIADVGLPAAYASHYPHQLSGGQRQRVNIARALVVQPQLVVLDEAVSALDKSIQAQVLNLLSELQEQYGLTYVFISHDLNVVEYISDEVVVMYLGQVVEQSPAEELYRRPLHPYSQVLLSAIPNLDPTRSRRDESVNELDGEIPSPIDPPSGCRFRTRCPFAQDVCAAEKPERVEVEPNHFVACHIYTGKVTIPTTESLIEGAHA
ncbi:MAG: ABC transporter ATP-binding protein [Cumulibacter sp.]